MFFLYYTNNWSQKLSDMSFLWMIQFQVLKSLERTKTSETKENVILAIIVDMICLVCRISLTKSNVHCIRPCILHPTTTFHIYLAYLDYKNWLIHLEKLVVQDALLQLAKNWPRFPPLLLSTHSVLVTRFKSFLKFHSSYDLKYFYLCF